ncbi:hypothetical protein F9282_07295 [Proteus terrae subsp. cibarius]|uniref:Phage protein n=1 Tax=Proteus terrae subsp. cibarius TaxID=626774 RepID=A0ABX6JR39_9GAMM|nr:hypothetical protein [Proteus terrae]QGW02797.1 hypothetical protein F9282_07295 [Proteus terrae subsp. cibarius]QIF90191.1 hypothetical protein GTH23_09120 [Proteus terrae subsp. cibarius]
MKSPILASVKFDTSRLDKKIEELKSTFSDGVLEHLLSVLPSLFSKIILTDNPSTGTTFSINEVVYFLDLDAGAYNEILVTARALEANVTHTKKSPINGKSPEEILEHFKKYNFVDDHGHRLEFCQDFIDLVALATK